MTNSKETKVLLSGYYGFDNFGDEAILGVLANKLKEEKTDITAFSSNPKKTSELYGIKTVYFKNYAEIIKKCFNTDILISGGGSLLQDVSSIKSIIYYLAVINTALFFGKKVLIFAQGIGPINNKFAGFLTKKTLQRCQQVTVRDRKSRLLLHKWGIDAKLLCDPLFSLQLPQYQPQNKVGVQLRSFKSLSDTFLIKLAEQIVENFSDKEIDIFSFQDSLDTDVCKNFDKMLKTLNPNIQTKIFETQTSQDILNNISHLEYMIAMRFHANLIAIKYGIKTLAVSYDIKVDKLAEEANIPCITLSEKQSFSKAFEKLKKINSQEILEYANTKTFDFPNLLFK